MIDIYKACVLNVRDLKSRRNNLKRLANQQIMINQHQSYETLTKVYALLYSAFAEVCFLKMIHTPYGFPEKLIEQIQKEKSIDNKWTKCVDLAFHQINNNANSGDIQNKKKKILTYIEKYIIEPSQLRNKIAHGQWNTALNSDNTAVNHSTSKQIQELDFVKIDILFSMYEKISQIIEDLIESPFKAHFNFFYSHLTELELLEEKTKGWSIHSKIKMLKLKKSKTRHSFISKVTNQKNS